MRVDSFWAAIIASINSPLSSKYYKERLESFALCSASTERDETELTYEQISNTAIWKNKFICANNKSVFNRQLFNKGLIRVGDLITERNQYISRSNLLKSFYEKCFYLIALFDSIPAIWRQSLKMKRCVDKEPFTL